MKTFKNFIILIAVLSFISSNASAQLPPYNVALNKSVIVSSENADKPGSNAVDGDISSDDSRWFPETNNAGAFPHWIEINLEDSFKISGLKVYTGWNSNSGALNYTNPVGYKFEYWNGEGWTEILNDLDNKKGKLDTTFAEVITTKVKFTALQSNDGTGKLKMFEIEVIGTPTKILPTDVVINQPLLSVVKGGDTQQYTSTIVPDYATEKALSWASLNESIATIDNDGNVSGISVGETQVVVYTEEENITDTAKIIVTENIVSAESVELDHDSLEILMLTSAGITETVLPDSTTDRTVTWTSGNTEIATVDNKGNITPNSPGEVYIIVNTNDGNHKDTCVVTVNPIQVEGITLNKSKMYLFVGYTGDQLIASIKPDSATDKTINWESADPGIASVDDNGNVTAVSKGITTITATTNDGGYTASCTVECVNEEDDPITIASIDTSLAEITIHVDNQHANANDANIGNDPNFPKKTINSAWEYVMNNYTLQNKGARILIHPGTYRVTQRMDYNFNRQIIDNNHALLIIEGTEPNKITIKGSVAEGWEASTWELVDAEKKIYKHHWPYLWGFEHHNYAWIKEIEIHRRELFSLNGDLLDQEVLEVFERPSRNDNYTYQGYKSWTELKPGQFGVSEFGPGDVWNARWDKGTFSYSDISASGSGDKPVSDDDAIFFRLPPGMEALTEDDVIEIGVANGFFAFKHKGNVIFRNINFTHCANYYEGMTAYSAAIVSIYNKANEPVENFVIENCRFVNNGGNALKLNADPGIKHTIIKNCIFDNNGNSHYHGGMYNSVIEDCSFTRGNFRGYEYGVRYHATSAVGLGGQNVRIRNCNFEENYTGYALRVDVNGGYTIVDSCNISNNYGGGTFWEIGTTFLGKGGVFNNCKMNNNTIGVGLMNQVGFELNNCEIMYNRDVQMTFFANPNRTNLGKWEEEKPLPTCEEVFINNSTFKSEGDVLIYAFLNYDQSEFETTINTSVFDNNTYCNETNSDMFSFPGFNRTDFAGWKSETGMDQNSTGCENVEVLGINLSLDTLDIELGASFSIDVQFVPKQATNQAYSFSLSNDNISVTDDNGQLSITGDKLGQSKIIVTTEEGSFKDTIVVNILEEVAVKGIAINSGTVLLLEDKSIEIQASLLPLTASNKKINWKVVDEAVASVDTAGIITGKLTGTTKAVALSDDGAHSDTIDVWIYDKETDWQTVTFDDFESGIGNFKSGENTTIGLDPITNSDAVILTPANTLEIKRRFNISNKGQIVVNFDFSTTGFTDDQENFSFEIFDGENWNNITDFNNWIHFDNDTKYSESIVVYTDMTDFTKIAGFRFVINNSFSEELKVYIDNVEILVNDFDPLFIPLTSASILPEEATIDVGAHTYLTAVLRPNDATNKSITWSSEDESIAIVDDDGKVTGIAAGTVNVGYITDDGDHTAFCGVIVNNPTGVIQKGNNIYYRVYPNPFDDKLIVYVDTTADIILYNYLGSRIYQKANISGRTEINFSESLPSGVYIMKLVKQNETKLIKVLKK